MDMSTSTKMTVKRARLIVFVDPSRCTGCGNCVRACLTGALQIVGGRAKLVDERLCDGFGSCIAVCPNGAIRLEYREAEDFDWSVLDRLGFEDLMRKLRTTSVRGIRTG